MRDDVNSEFCHKCSGTGYIARYAHTDEGICYDCNGEGRRLRAQVKQPSTRRPVKLADATVGDIVVEYGTKYEVTAVLWVRLKHGRSESQKLTTRRLVDGNTEHVMYRDAFVASDVARVNIDGAWVPSMVTIRTSDAMRGQHAERDERGEWIVY